MTEELDRHRLQDERQKAVDEKESTQKKIDLDTKKIELDTKKFTQDDKFVNRHLGVVITAATTVLGLWLSLTQLLVTHFEKRNELSQQALLSQATQTQNAAELAEKQLEFDFREHKDLREFIVAHRSEISSKDSDVRTSIVTLILETYRPEIAAPVIRQFEELGPDGHKETWKAAYTKLAKFRPDTGWCYQEKLPSGKYGAYCHSSESNCLVAKEGSRTATACIEVNGLSQNIWRPNPKGYFGSWYEVDMSNLLPKPFPQP